MAPIPLKPSETAPDAANAGRLYVLDAHGLIFQMYHAIPPMTAPDGRPTNAVYGITRALMNKYDEQAEYLIAVFDRKEPTFREKLYPDYKAHRPPAPDDLHAQEPMIARILEAMRIPALSFPGFEADDLLATLASEGAARGLLVYLCTSDKDCRQLLNDRVKILNLRKGETLDAAGLAADWGIRPDQVVDFQALVGDSVDNVPGVSGWGAKTTAKWLQKFETLDNLVAHADEVGGPKVRDSLKAAVADGSLELSRTLVRLDAQVPLEFDWEGWKRREWDAPKLVELFQEYGFREFGRRARSVMMASGAAKNQSILESIGESGNKEKPAVRAPTAPKLPRPDRPSLFDALDSEEPEEVYADDATDFSFGANEKPVETWELPRQTVTDLTQLTKIRDSLASEASFGCHFLVEGAELVGLALASHTESFYIPFASVAEKLNPAEVLSSLRQLWETESLACLCHDGKRTTKLLLQYGIPFRAKLSDPELSHYLIHSGDRTHTLEELFRRFFGREPISLEELLGKGKKRITLDRLPLEKVRDFACESAEAVLRLSPRLEAELEAEGLRKLYETIEVPLTHLLARIETTGVRVDVPFLKELAIEMDGQLQTLETEIHQLAGREFNVASPKQLREVLFDVMKLPVKKRTGLTGEASTDQETLERLATQGHELPRKILEHRQVAKLKGTYVDALPELVNAKTGRVHGGFHQTVAATGRLSSSDPNLQNIPARTDQGRRIRRAFIPQESWQMLTVDYSQIELRLLAHFSKDEELISSFRDGADIHARVAARILGIAESQVTSDQRRAAKTVNFGVIYGMSAHGLALRLGITKSAADKFIDDYFSGFPRVLDYQNRLLAEARKNGKVSTLLGRRRKFDPSGIRSVPNHRNRTQAEREAINMEIQGSAADLMKKAMLDVDRAMQTEKLAARMLLTVHDELVFEVPSTEVDQLARLVRREMTLFPLDVPLVVDLAVGPNWLDVEDYPGEANS